jgi:hypothetical protein
MRRDMSKVIVERARRGGRVGKGRYKNFNLEDLPIKEGMRHPRKYGKELNENLAPLYRFVQSQVGRPWNKVYSEIREFINSNSTIQQHVLVHLFKGLVNVNETKVHPLAWGELPWWQDFYVDDHGLLKETAKHPESKKRARQRAKNDEIKIKRRQN